jgi:hypothetical protein
MPNTLGVVFYLCEDPYRYSAEMVSAPPMIAQFGSNDNLYSASLSCSSVIEKRFHAAAKNFRGDRKENIRSGDA